MKKDCARPSKLCRVARRTRRGRGKETRSILSLLVNEKQFFLPSSIVTGISQKKCIVPQSGERSKPFFSVRRTVTLHSVHSISITDVRTCRCQGPARLLPRETICASGLHRCASQEDRFGSVKSAAISVSASPRVRGT